MDGQRIIGLWRTSFSYLISLKAQVKLADAMWRHTSFLLFLTTAICASLVSLGLVYPLVSKVFLYIPVPLISILSSVLYVPYLVYCYTPVRQRQHTRYYMQQVLNSVLFYAVAAAAISGGLILFSLMPAYYHDYCMAACLMVLPVILFFLLAGPFVMLAQHYSIKELSKDSSLWKHGIEMTLGEIPFLLGMFVYLSPFGLLIYAAHLWMTSPLFTAAFQHYISLLYWQVGWSLVIAFYQEQKKRYL